MLHYLACAAIAYFLARYLIDPAPMNLHHAA